MPTERYAVTDIGMNCEDRSRMELALDRVRLRGFGTGDVEASGSADTLYYYLKEDRDTSVNIRILRTKLSRQRKEICNPTSVCKTLPTETAKESTFDSRQGQHIPIVPITYRPLLGPIKPPAQCVRGPFPWR
jgi:hypothetical protein